MCVRPSVCLSVLRINHAYSCSLVSFPPPPPAPADNYNMVASMVDRFPFVVHSCVFCFRSPNHLHLGGEIFSARFRSHQSSPSSSLPPSLSTSLDLPHSLSLTHTHTLSHTHSISLDLSLSRPLSRPLSLDLSHVSVHQRGPAWQHAVSLCRPPRERPAAVDSSVGATAAVLAPRQRKWT